MRVFVGRDRPVLVPAPQQVRHVVFVGGGPRGADGASGSPGSAGAQIVELIAAETLGGNRVVVAATDGARLADIDNLGHADSVVGITTGAASIATLASIQSSGEMTEPSWNWTPETPIFAGYGGTLTQTANASKWSQIIAVALTAQRILIAPKQALIL